MQIFCDFDGTITKEDSVDYILQSLAEKEWLEIEQKWQDGLINSAQCMKSQITLIKASQERLNLKLKEISIDPTFADFVKFCQSINVQITIISDGVDYFIKKICENHNLPTLPIIANKLLINQDKYNLELPYNQTNCKVQSAVCKCQSIQSSIGKKIYIGNGRSDFCVSHQADIIFAKDDLATYCKNNQLSFIAYKDFSDIVESFYKL